MKQSLICLIALGVFLSCGRKTEYNEDKNVVWSDTIITEGYRAEYSIRNYNKEGLLVSSYSYGYLDDDNIQELIARKYHYQDSILVLIEENNKTRMQYPTVRYLFHYNKNNQITDVMQTNTVGNSILCKSEYKYNENGDLIEWKISDYSSEYLRTDFFQYFYKSGKLVKVFQGKEKTGIESYEYKVNGNLGKIVDMRSWRESNLIYNSFGLVVKNRNELFKYDNKNRIYLYKKTDEMLGDTTTIILRYGTRPSNIENSNRFVYDGGRFVNSRGQVYYKLCDFNNNYLPDGLGIREQL